MIPLVQIKDRLEFNDNLSQIIETLKIVASVGLREFQARLKENDDFLAEVKNAISAVPPDVSHPFLTANGEHKLYVVITSDEGFLGGVNSRLLETVLNEKSVRDSILVFGRKGADYLRSLKVSYKMFPGLGDRIKPKEIYNLKNYIMQEYVERQFSQVSIVYLKFISVMFQHVTKETILPFKVSSQDRLGWEKEDVLFESKIDSLIEELIGFSLSHRIMEIFYSSKLSEFSARLMHLERSSQKLEEVNKKLFWQYFKSLHISMDKSIREIFASRLLWKKS